jgi:hypothetical protein
LATKISCQNTYSDIRKTAPITQVRPLLIHLEAEGAFYANKATNLTPITTQGRNVQNKHWFYLKNEAICKRSISHTHFGFRLFAVAEWDEDRGQPPHNQIGSSSRNVDAFSTTMRVLPLRAYVLDNVEEARISVFKSAYFRHLKSVLVHLIV